MTDKPHTHDHHHDNHNHVHMPTNFDRAFMVGIALNLGFVIIETIYGFSANSLALLADAGHNFIDVIGLVLAWLASWLMRRLPTKRHTYGLGRVSILASLVNAIALLMATGAIAWESVQRFVHPEPVVTKVVIGVAMIGIVINLGTAFMFMAGRKEDLNIRGAFLHMMADAAITLGVVVGAVLMMVTHYLWIDPVLSLGIVLLIGFSTWSLLKDSFSLAFDAIPREIDRDAVEAYFLSLPGVIAIHDLHIWPLSTTAIALTVHLVSPDAHTDDQLLCQINIDLSKKFKINHVTTQIERGDAIDCPLSPQEVV
jgi:cobalt-zinc-cadmium efflux system protein